MHITANRAGDTLTLGLDGRLDIATAPLLEQQTDQPGVRSLVIDLGACTYVSSAGLRELLRAQKRLTAAGGSVQLVNVTRAVQDVLFCPEFHDRYPGTTLRCYDAPTGLWHITWMSPYSGSYVTQTGRSDGEGGMIQEGTSPEGARSRWIFTEVTPVSFRWRGYSADADGGEFELVQEMHATRG